MEVNFEANNLISQLLLLKVKVNAPSMNSITHCFVPSDFAGLKEKMLEPSN